MANSSTCTASYIFVPAVWCLVIAIAAIAHVSFEKIGSSFLLVACLASSKVDASSPRCSRDLALFDLLGIALSSLHSFKCSFVCQASFREKSLLPALITDAAHEPIAHHLIKFCTEITVLCKFFEFCHKLCNRFSWLQ